MQVIIKVQKEYQSLDRYNIQIFSQHQYNMTSSTSAELPNAETHGSLGLALRRSQDFSRIPSLKYFAKTSPNNTIVNVSTLEDQSHKIEYMTELETKIDNEIGYRFWKKYVNAAFWSYISLPINLSITMLTALSTGQATTNNLLPQTLYINISLATLVISVLNTYFRPYVQMNQNVEYMNKWSVLGYQFEEIYYSEKQTIEHIELRIDRYEHLLKEINNLKKTEILETQNFLTDSIHLALRSCYCCLKNKNSWLSLDETLKEEAEENDEKKHPSETEPSVQVTTDQSPKFTQIDFFGTNITNITEFDFSNEKFTVSPEMSEIYYDVPLHDDDHPL